MRENMDQNNSEYGPFSRSDNQYMIYAGHSLIFINYEDQNICLFSRYLLCRVVCFNSFVNNVPFLYPLVLISAHLTLWQHLSICSQCTLSLPTKTSENRKVFLCFQGLQKRCIGNKQVKEAAVKHVLMVFSFE